MLNSVFESAAIGSVMGVALGFILAKLKKRRQLKRFATHRLSTIDTSPSYTTDECGGALWIDSQTKRASFVLFDELCNANEEESLTAECLLRISKKAIEGKKLKAQKEKPEKIAESLQIALKKAKDGAENGDKICCILCWDICWAYREEISAKLKELGFDVTEQRLIGDPHLCVGWADKTAGGRL